MWSTTSTAPTMQQVCDPPGPSPALVDRPPTANQDPAAASAAPPRRVEYIAAAISMTQPMVRSGPTTSAMVSTVMPFCSPPRPSVARCGLISSQAHRVSYAFISSNTISNGSVQVGDLAQVHARARRHLQRLVRHLDPYAVARASPRRGPAIARSGSHRGRPGSSRPQPRRRSRPYPARQSSEHSSQNREHPVELMESWL